MWTRQGRGEAAGPGRAPGNRRIVVHVKDSAMQSRGSAPVAQLVFESMEISRHPTPKAPSGWGVGGRGAGGKEREGGGDARDERVRTVEEDQ